jgi:hypothetical protein
MTDDAVLFDQRGAPFGRVYDGDGVSGARIDIGAVEAQPIPHAVFGDYNEDGTVNAADYTVWRNAAGETVTPFDSPDGDGSGTADLDDYLLWKSLYGETVPTFELAMGTAFSLESLRTTNDLARNLAPNRLPPGDQASAAVSDRIWEGLFLPWTLHDAEIEVCPVGPGRAVTPITREARDASLLFSIAENRDPGGMPQPKGGVGERRPSDKSGDVFQPIELAFATVTRFPRMEY